MFQTDLTTKLLSFLMICQWHEIHHFFHQMAYHCTSFTSLSNWWCLWVRWYDHFLSSPSRRLRQKSWLRKSCLTSHFPPKLRAHHWINLSSFCEWCCTCICLCFTVFVCICLVGRTFLSKVQAGTLGTKGRWIPCGLKRKQVNNSFQVWRCLW